MVAPTQHSDPRQEEPKFCLWSGSLIFITSWESINVGVVEESFDAITPGKTLLREKESSKPGAAN